jgi:hypothetical protein
MTNSGLLPGGGEKKRQNLFFQGGRTPSTNQAPNQLTQQQYYVDPTVRVDPEETAGFFQGLDSDLQTKLKADREAYTSGAIAETQAQAMLEAGRVEPSGFMGGVMSAIDFIMPGVQGDHFSDAVFDTNLVESNQQFQEKSYAHALAGQAIAGMLSPLTAVEMAFVAKLPNRFKGIPLASLALRRSHVAAKTIAAPIYKKSLARLAGSGIIPTKKIPSAVRKATLGMPKGPATDLKALTTVFPRAGTERLKQTLKIANKVVGADVPQSVLQRGTAASAAFIMLRNGTIDASAYSMMTALEKADVHPNVVLAAGLIAGATGYYGAGKLATRTLGVKAIDPVTKAPKAPASLVDEINEIHIEQFPEGVGSISSPKSGKGKNRVDRFIDKTTGPLEYSVKEDPLQTESVRIMRRRGSYDEIVAGEGGELKPFTGRGSYVEDKSYFIDPDTGARKEIIDVDPVTGEKLSLRQTGRDDMTLGGQPFAKSYGEIHVNTEMLKSDWNELPAAGWGWYRDPYNETLEITATPGKSFFEGATDEERFKNYKDYRMLQELIKTNPRLFGADTLDLQRTETLNIITQRVWAYIKRQGVIYSDSSGTIALPSFMDRVIKENPLVLHKGTKDIQLESIYGKRSLFGMHQSINNETRVILDGKKQQYLFMIDDAYEQIHRIFTSTEETIEGFDNAGYYLRPHVNVGVKLSEYDVLKNPEKYREILRDILENPNQEVVMSLDYLMTQIQIIARTMDDVRGLIEQTGGGLTKYRPYEERLALNRIQMEEQFPMGKGTEPLDSSLNFNFIPEAITKGPDDVVNYGDDGARFWRLADGEAHPPIPDEPFYMAGDWKAEAIRPGRLIKYPQQVQTDIDGVIIENKYIPIDDLIDNGAQVSSPINSIKEYIDSGLKMVHQRHVWNEILSMGDQNSDLAEMLYYGMNWGDGASAMTTPYTYRHIVEMGTGTKQAKKNIKNIIQTARKNTQPANVDKGFLTEKIEQTNMFGVMGGTTLDWGGLMSLGGMTVGKNIEFAVSPKTLRTLKSAEGRKIYWKGFGLVARGFVKMLGAFTDNRDAAALSWRTLMESPRGRAGINRGAVLYDDSPQAFAKEFTTGKVPKWMLEFGKLRTDTGALMRFQRSFVSILNDLRLDGAQHQIDLETIVNNGVPPSPAKQMQIQSGWNLLTGAPVRTEGQVLSAGDNMLLGLKGASTNMLQFASRFTTAQFQTLHNMILQGGPQAQVARSALTYLVGGMSTITFLANAGLYHNGKGPIDPFDSISPIDWDKLKNGEFRINKNWMVIGRGEAEYDLSMMIKPLAGMAIETPVNFLLQKGDDTDEWNLMNDLLKASDNLVTRKASPVLSWMWDASPWMGKGRDFHNRPLHPWGQVIDYDANPDPVTGELNANLGGIKMNDPTEFDQWGSMVWANFSRFIPFWGAAGPQAFMEEMQYLQEGIAFPFTAEDESENLKRIANMGIRSLEQMNADFWALRLRTSSPKDRVERLFLQDKEINNSIPPKQWKDATPVQKRLMEEKYPKNFEVLRSYEVQTPPSRDQQYWIEARKVQVEGLYDIARALGMAPDKITGEFLEGMHTKTLKDGELVYPEQADRPLKDVVDDIKRIRARIYAEQDSLRTEWGKGLTKGSNGRQVQNAVRIAYQVAKLPNSSEIDFTILDNMLANIEKDILAGGFGAENEQDRFDNLSVFQDQLPPNTGIPFVDSMIMDTRTIARAGWWDFYDEAMKKYGKEYYSVYTTGGDDGDLPIQSYSQLIKEINIMEYNKRQFDKMRQMNKIPDEDIERANANRLQKANKLKRQIDTFVTDSRDDLMKMGDKVIWEAKDPLNVGMLSITGIDLRNAVVDLGLRKPD